MSAASLHKMPSECWMTAKQCKISLTKNFWEDIALCDQAVNVICLDKNGYITSGKSCTLFIF